MKYLVILVSLLTLTSCLKKIEEVETANTNIFDPEYGGDKWWNYGDLYLWTNSNNDQKVRIQVVIPQSYAPDLQPLNIPLSISVNGGGYNQQSAVINQSCYYTCNYDINPQSTTNYCIDVGVYVEEEDTTINVFSECKSL